MSQLEQRYASSWPRARATYERALESLPGGNTRTQVHVEPFPLYAERGSGARMLLTDGVEVDDFLLNYSAAALGHCHPAVAAATHRGIDAGGPFGLPVPAEALLAERLRERFDGVELARFANSGSEATLQAVRAARAFTDRPRIAKAEGGYHGSHDLVDIGITRFGRTPGEALGETRGMAPEVVAGVSVFPYNDLDGALAVLEPQAGALAGVLIEVFLNSSGVIPARPEFLRGIADWCAAHRVLLILDEVASWRTGWRGAAAEHHGLRPDLICIGKALGGGFPIGALGGRAEVMAVFDPRGGSIVRHAGTFNGHPVAMSAGLAVLEALDERAIARMNAQGRRLAEGAQRIGREHGVPLTATHYGGIGRLHIARTCPASAREAAALPREPRLDIYRALLERGVLVSPDCRFATCTATSDEQVQRFLAALAEAAPEALADGAGDQERSHV
ncbi:MAG: aspartate aminotransferase family protein [Solirubrobacteraceae bacterium]